MVSDFRTTQQRRWLFELATHSLALDGRLVFNAFLARQGYVPDEATRELGQQEHLPDGAWPPTNWYPNWTAGQDVFDLQREYVPIDMRWLVYGRIS